MECRSAGQKKNVGKNERNSEKQTKSQNSWRDNLLSATFFQIPLTTYQSAISSNKSLETFSAELYSGHGIWRRWRRCPLPPKRPRSWRLRPLQMGHGTRPFSLHWLQRRVKMQLPDPVAEVPRTIFLLPWQAGHGKQRYPPQLVQGENSRSRWKSKASKIEQIATNRLSFFCFFFVKNEYNSLQSNKKWLKHFRDEFRKQHHHLLKILIWSLWLNWLLRKN